ncbi:unnamed protein product [Lota lota]
MYSNQKEISLDVMCWVGGGGGGGGCGRPDKAVRWMERNQVRSELPAGQEGRIPPASDCLTHKNVVFVVAGALAPLFWQAVCDQLSAFFFFLLLQFFSLSLSLDPPPSLHTPLLPFPHFFGFCSATGSENPDAGRSVRCETERGGGGVRPCFSSLSQIMFLNPKGVSGRRGLAREEGFKNKGFSV